MSFRLLNLHVRVPLLMLAMVEGAILVLVALLVARFGRDPASGTPALTGPLVFASYALLSVMAVGLYSTRQRCNTAGVIVRIAVAIVMAAALSALTLILVTDGEFGGRSLIVTAAIAVVAFTALRLAVERFGADNVFKRRILIFGAGRRAASLLTLRRRSDYHGFRLVGFVAAQGEETSVPAERMVGRPANLLEYAQAHDVDEIVLAMDDRRIDFPMAELMECRLAGLDVLELGAFLERESAKVRLDVVNASWFVFGRGFRCRRYQQKAKRAFDIAVSLALLILALPVIVLTMLAIFVEDGPRAAVFYRQRRVGRYNKPFDMLKFRSMKENAEENGAVWAEPNDPRITRVGAFIRPSRIDELPQLFNVLRGDMSFVGPRPERPEFVDSLVRTLPFYGARHAVKPGITGWAQLCYPYGSSDKDALEKLQYDLYYVKNRSLIFDLAILIQTVEVVIWRKGAR